MCEEQDVFSQRASVELFCLCVRVRLPENETNVSVRKKWTSVLLRENQSTSVDIMERFSPFYCSQTAEQLKVVSLEV